MVDETNEGLALSGGPGTYLFLQNEQEVRKKDLSVPKATMPGLVNYVKSRAEIIKANKDATHFQINKRKAKMALLLGEFGGFRSGEAAYQPCTTITATAKFSEDYIKARGFMKTHASAHNLAMELRELPHLFSSNHDYLNAVSEFRTMAITLKKVLEDTSNDAGMREKRIKLTFEDGIKAIKWAWSVAIYEGEEKQTIPVDVLYEANESMNGVNIRLVNFDLANIERAALDAMLARTIKEIEGALGDGVVPMLYVDSKSTEGDD